MEKLKDITEQRLEVGEIGVFRGVKYRAVACTQGACGDCDILESGECVGNLKCWTLSDVDFMLKRVN